MPCSHTYCEAPSVLSTATESTAHLNLCGVHLAEARGIGSLRPPYRLESFTQRTGAATRAWPQGASLATPKTTKTRTAKRRGR